LNRAPSRLRRRAPSFGPSASPSSTSQLEAPLPLPRRNLCLRRPQLHAHAKELSGSVFKARSAHPEAWPIVFTKVPSACVGPHDEVAAGAVSEQIDYEAELAVVIGRGGSNISRPTRWSTCSATPIVNDVTARDVQMRHQQWDLGKSFDTFCPMGPWIVTADEFDGTHTRVRCWVNGELRQDGRPTT
jgi:2-keto-4-pentenoate hydratase/2-oxohepta-3-ene-1,7-dioic acid hydratase in catechol pathway